MQTVKRLILFERVCVRVVVDEFSRSPQKSPERCPRNPHVTSSETATTTAGGRRRPATAP